MVHARGAESRLIIISITMLVSRDMKWSGGAAKGNVTMNWVPLLATCCVWWASREALVSSGRGSGKWKESSKESDAIIVRACGCRRGGRGEG